MGVMKGIYTKHEDLIRSLALNAPYEAHARHFFFEGAKVVLNRCVDTEEIEYIIEGANSLVDDIFEVLDDFND